MTIIHFLPLLHDSTYSISLTHYMTEIHFLQSIYISSLTIWQDIPPLQHDSTCRSCEYLYYHNVYKKYVLSLYRDRKWMAERDMRDTCFICGRSSYDFEHHGYVSHTYYGGCLCFPVMLAISWDKQ